MTEYEDRLMVKFVARAQPGEITAGDTARMLGYDEYELGAVYKLIGKGLITARKVPVGKLSRWLIEKASVERYRDTLTGYGLHNWWRDPDWRDTDWRDGRWHCLKCGQQSCDSRLPLGTQKPSCRGYEQGLAKLGLVYARS